MTLGSCFPLSGLEEWTVSNPVEILTRRRAGRHTAVSDCGYTNIFNSLGLLPTFPRQPQSPERSPDQISDQGIIAGNPEHHASMLLLRHAPEKDSIRKISRRAVTGHQPLAESGTVSLGEIFQQ